jgi:phosphoserine aminotransferase
MNQQTSTDAISAPADRSERQYNFSAGPAVLPREALLEAKDELPVYGHTGTSVMEISHRSAAYDDIEESAREHIKSLLDIGEDWHVLFLQGGASMQFYQTPLNFLTGDGVADYVITGRWGTKAIEEARLVGDVNVAASTEDDNFSYVPEVEEWDLTHDADYVYVTTNETVNGNQITTDPVLDAPIIADASSEFLSRPMDLEGYGLVFAGAQKNAGPAGVTVVLVHDDFLEQKKETLPTMLDYGTHVRRRYNTPPTFPIYMVEKVTRWLRNMGGLDTIHAVNKRKAGMLYDRIEQTDFYYCTVEEGSRSMMNVTFRLRDSDLEDLFLKQAEQRGLMSLAGHRTVGGVRASIYNAMPVEGVAALVQFMDEFERAYG